MTSGGSEKSNKESVANYIDWDWNSRAVTATRSESPCLRILVFW
jgi:hypothetical protein